MASQNRKSIFALATTGALAAVLATACASVPPPTENMAGAQSAVRGAREVGADSVPQAALHLKLAEEQIARAKALIADGENQRAWQIISRARADAELALALARETQAQADAQRALAELNELRQMP